MGASFSMLRRAYQALISPPVVRKTDDAVRIGLLGASAIAPIAIINPAKSHSEAIIAAVAARDPVRAGEYAKKHGIPIVHNSYQELLDDPSIDAVYIALPNGYHYEWAVRSLQAGKHVLLEKPSTSNAEEAKKLFSLPLFSAKDAPVLLEAFHYQFHPAWQIFLDEVRNSGIVESASAVAGVPKGIMKPNDIRFQYAIAGGCMMDLGTYPLSCVRQVMGREAVELVDNVEYRGLPMKKDGNIPDPQIDQAILATFRTATGKQGKIEADLSVSSEFPMFFPKGWRINIPSSTMPKCEAVMEETVLPDKLLSGAEHRVRKVVTMWNFMMPVVYHRIDVAEHHCILQEGKEIKRWTHTTYKKAYNWPVGDARAGQYKDYFTTWRSQLEEFVARIKGRKGSGVWVDGEESIRQMEGIDAVYTKAGLLIRPTSAYCTNIE